MKRLDNELVERGLFKTRSKATLAIKAKQVYCDGKLITKCGYEVGEKTQIEILGKKLPYVSRGGLKLEKAIETWKLDLSQKVMIDIGSSTGGFSDCALQNHVQKIYAIDVGTNQFDQELAKNEKVILMEKTDFRTLPEKEVMDANFVTIDVSFISVSKLWEKLSKLIQVKEIVCLIKPQFECGKAIADQYHGIILNPDVHQEIIERIIKGFQEIDFHFVGITSSPIRGGDGNIEYLAYFQRGREEENFEMKDEILKTIREAFTLK